LRDIQFHLNDGRWIHIWRKFILDFGSVPKSLRSIVPPLGTAADMGFAAHDGLYAEHRDNTPYVVLSDPFTRKEADKAMMEIHLHCGVSQELAEGMYAGVRMGASRSWMSPEEKLASGIIQELPDYYE